MLGWLFGGFVKKLERVALGFVKESSQEVGYLFDTKLYPKAYKLDYIAEERIKQAIEGTEKIESKVKADIESLLDKADDKVKHNLVLGKFW